MSIRPNFLFYLFFKKAGLLLSLLSASGPIVAVFMIHSLYYFILLAYLFIYFVKIMDLNKYLLT